jgi:hypothetical protein
MTRSMNTGRRLRYGVPSILKYHYMLNSNEHAYLLLQSSGNREPNFITPTRVQNFSTCIVT